jgi:hypothetical protein
VTDIPKLNRPDFFDGQSLTAADLSAVQSYHQELLWLHQRSLHDSGIASGFTVTGAKGDRAVTVGPGYAIDTAGRSVILDKTTVFDIPAVVAGPSGGAITFYLTVAYVPDDELAATVRAGTCGSNGAVRRAEQPLLAWRDPRDVADDIVLCAISVANCKLTGPVDVSLRRSALPERQPFVFAGQFVPAANQWALWRGGDTADGPIFGLKLAVNTSKAGFANTPKYQAHVVGSRTFLKPDDPGKGTAAAVDGYVQISAASADGFELQMTLPKGDDRVNPEWILDKDVLPGLPGRNVWYVSWLGVEI